uniref:IP13549p n=1 Tax=Drosophila melanogaster TaxID=7227 RepID=Q1EC89_DROME|nr:IP13549p [Drosophila melanogaster]
MSLAMKQPTNKPISHQSNQPPPITLCKCHTNAFVNGAKKKYIYIYISAISPPPSSTFSHQKKKLKKITASSQLRSAQIKAPMSALRSVSDPPDPSAQVVCCLIETTLINFTYLKELLSNYTTS